jgi:hypothetical protein
MTRESSGRVPLQQDVTMLVNLDEFSDQAAMRPRLRRFSQKPRPHKGCEPPRAARGRLRLLGMGSATVVFFEPAVRRPGPQWCALVFQWWNCFEVLFFKGRIDTIGIVIKLNEQYRPVNARSGHRYVALLASILVRGR